MSTLKHSIFWVALYLGAVFVLAQFDYTDYPIIDFAKYFYFTVMVTVPSVIFFPSISKIPALIPLIIWGGIYLVMLQVLDRTASAPNSTFPVVLLEFILVEIGVWLGYQLAYGISHAESIMDAMALTAFPNRTQHIHEAGKQIKTEFTRSRRFHRPLSLLVLQIHIDDHVRIKEMVASIQHDLWNRFSFARIGQVIDEHVRQTDLVFRDRGGRFVILCPETDQDNTQILAERIVEVIAHRIGLRVDSGVAGFPTDAINFDDLMDVAVSRLAHTEKSTSSNRKPESVEVHG